MRNDYPFASVENKRSEEDKKLQNILHDLEVIYSASELPPALTWQRTKARYEATKTSNTVTRSASLRAFWRPDMGLRPTFSMRVLVPLLVIIILGASAFSLVPPLVDYLGLEPSTNGIVDANEFVAIHQTHSIPGVTITLEEAYADSNQVIISYKTSYTNDNLQVQDLSLRTQEGLDLSHDDGDMTVGESQSDGNQATTTMVFDASKIPTRLTTLHLHLVYSFSDTTSKATSHKGNPSKSGQPSIAFNFSIPFHGGRVAILNQSMITASQRVTLEHAAITKSSMRIVVQGLTSLEHTHGLAAQLLPPGTVRSYDYGTASPKADGSLAFVYPFDFSAKHGTWTLTITQNNRTWVFHFNVP